MFPAKKIFWDLYGKSILSFQRGVCCHIVTEKDSLYRSQDVRATEKDKVKIYNSFRPGDVVRAEVISLGDARSYMLSTAKNELGVIFATSVAGTGQHGTDLRRGKNDAYSRHVVGATMIPISWQEMQCPITKTIEYRKCAKPF